MRLVCLFRLSLCLAPVCSAQAQSLYLRPGATDLANSGSWEASAGDVPAQFTAATHLHVLLPESLQLRLGDLAAGKLTFDNGASVELEDGRFRGQLIVDSGQGHHFRRLAIAGVIVIGKAMSNAPMTLAFEASELLCRRADSGSRAHGLRGGNEMNNPLASLITHSNAVVEFTRSKLDVDCAHLSSAVLRNSQVVFDRLVLGGQFVATPGSVLKARGPGAHLEFRLTAAESSLQACEVEVPSLVVRLGKQDQAALLTVSPAAPLQIGKLDLGGAPGSRLLVNGKSLAAVAREGGQGRDVLVDEVTVHLGEPGRAGLDLASAALIARARAVVCRGSVRLSSDYRPARLASERVLLIGKADVELAGGRLQGRTILILDDLEEIQQAAGPGFQLPGNEEWDERAQSTYARPRAPGDPAEPDAAVKQGLRDRIEPIAQRAAELAQADVQRWGEVMQSQATRDAVRALRQTIDEAGGKADQVDVGKMAGILRQLFNDKSRAGEPPAGSRAKSEDEPRDGAELLGDLADALAAATSEPDYATVVQGHGVLVGDVELAGQLRPDDTMNHLGSAHAMQVEGNLHVKRNGGILLPISVDTKIAFGPWSGATQFVHDHLGGDLGDRLAQAWLTLGAHLEEGVSLGAVFGSVRYYKRAVSAVASRLLFVTAVASFAKDVADHLLHGGAHFPVHVSGRLDLGTDPAVGGVLRPTIQPEFVAELEAGQMFRGLRAEGSRSGRRARFPAVIEDCVAVVAEPETPNVPQPQVPPGLTSAPHAPARDLQAATESKQPKPPPFVPVPPPVPAPPAEDGLFFFEDYAHKQVNIGVAKLPRRLWRTAGELHSEPLSRDSVATHPLRTHITVVIHGADSACDPHRVAAESSAFHDAVTWPVAGETEVGVDQLAAAHLFAASALGIEDRCEVWLIDWREFATGADDTHGWASGASVFSYLTERALTKFVDAGVHKLPGLGHGWTGSRRFLADSIVGHSADVISGLGSQLLALLGFDVEVFHAGLFLEASRVAAQIGKGLGHWLVESRISLTAVASVDVLAEGAGIWLGSTMLETLRHAPGWRAAGHLFAFSPPLGFAPERMRALGLSSFVEGLTLASDATARGSCRITLLGDARMSVYTGLATDGAWATYARPTGPASGLPMVAPVVAAYDIAWADPQMHFAVRWQHSPRLIAQLGEELPPNLRTASWLEDVVWSATAGVPTQRWVEGQLSAIDRETRTPVQATGILALAKSRGVIDRMHPAALFHGAVTPSPNLWSHGAAWPMEFYVRTMIEAVRAKRGRGPTAAPWSIWHAPRDSAIGFPSSGLAAAAGLGASTPAARNGLTELPVGDH